MHSIKSRNNNPCCVTHGQSRARDDDCSFVNNFDDVLRSLQLQSFCLCLRRAGGGGAFSQAWFGTHRKVPNHDQAALLARPYATT